jgi:hypothetical protein
MSGNQEIYVKVESDTDSLSARAVHDCFVNFVRAELEGGEVFLKALVPKREGDLFAHVGHKGPYDSGIEIEGSVGIPEIHKTGESDPFSAKYPIFVDKGTGIFAKGDTIFPKDKKFMYIPPGRGYPGFLAHSKGQRGKDFSLAAFSLMIGMLQVNGERFKAELTSRLDVNKILT